jgi:hypothetical protein
VGGLIEAARRWGGRITFGIVLTLVTFFIGLCGVIGVYAWLATDHWAAWRNENLFGYSPLAMPIAFLVPALIRRLARASRIVTYLGFAIVAFNVLGIILSPLLPQRIAEPMALILPINLAIAFSTRQYLANPQPSTQSPP